MHANWNPRPGTHGQRGVNETQMTILQWDRESAELKYRWWRNRCFGLPLNFHIIIIHFSRYYVYVWVTVEQSSELPVWKNTGITELNILASGPWIWFTTGAGIIATSHGGTNGWSRLPTGALLTYCSPPGWHRSVSPRDIRFPRLDVGTCVSSQSRSVAWWPCYEME